MNAIAPLAALFAAVEARHDRVAQTPWGAVVTDPRFPLIHDVNYARVDDGSGLTLAEVRRSLAPALRAAGAKAFHVATFDPVGSRPLLDELESEGARFTYDTAMRWKGPSPALRAHYDVVELDPAAPGFWDEQAELLPELDIRGDVLDQYLDWQRKVLVPFGKRWFAVRDERGVLLGSGALILHDDAAYVDDVVTVPAARRRGVASAVVMHLVEEGRRAGGEAYLLADEPDPIRLYERLGFVEAGLVVGAVLGEHRTHS